MKLETNNPLIDALKQLLREVVREEFSACSSNGNGKPESLLLDTKAAAARLNVPRTWLAARARAGEIASVKLGHHVRFRLEDLEKFLNQRAK